MRGRSDFGRSDRSAQLRHRLRDRRPSPC